MDSKKTLLLIAVFYGCSLLFFHNWGDYLLGNGDSFGYYNYLPAFFIHHDLTDAEGRQTAYARHRNQSQHDGEAFTPEDLKPHMLVGANYEGHYVNYYTCGVAMLQTPFFLAAHVLAKPLGYKTDGYSLPYRMGLAISGCFYGLLGLFFLRKILRGLFDEITTRITLLIIGMATNLYYFSTYNPFMAHSYLFCLVAMLMWATIRFYEAFERRYLFIIAFLGSFISLTRPTDALFLVVPFFYKVYSWRTLSERTQLLWSRKLDFLIAAFFFILPIIPQLFYWKLQTGHWIFNSYGELFKFNFKHPELKRGLFYFQNGWLAYTPVMWLAVLGIAFLFKKRDFIVPILLFLPIYCFVIYSWWCWNYINGLGSRPMIDAYALLAIPLSMSVDFIRKLPIWGRFPLFSLVGLLGLVNIWQTQQTNLQVLFSEDGSLPYVWNILPKTKLDYSALVAFDLQMFQPSNPTFIKTIYANNFEDSTASPNTIKTNTGNGLVSYKIPAQAYSPTYNGTIADFEEAKWVRISVKAFSPRNNIYELYQKSMLVVDIRRGDTCLEWRGVRLENKLGDADKIRGGTTNIWGEISYFVKIPSNIRPTDRIGCCVWCNNTYPIIIDDLKVEAYK